MRQNWNHCSTLAFVLGGISTGCTGDVPLGRQAPSPCDFVQPTAEERSIEVLTFWSEDIVEARALSVLRDRSQSVGLRVSLTADEDREALQSNLQEGKSELLPDVFQVNGGSDVLQYVGGHESPRICNLDRLASMYRVEERYFPSVLEPSSCAGSLYAWPLGVHRLNTLLVNQQVYERVQRQAELEGARLTDLSEMKSAADLFDLLEYVDSLHLTTEEGHEVAPLSLGIQHFRAGQAQPDGQEWVLLVVAFENLYASYGGGLYEKLWYGEDELAHDELQEALGRLMEDIERLGRFVDPEPKSWQEATQDVGSGRALLTIGGDWMRAQLDPSDLESERVASYPFPGTQDAFVYTPDSFAVPRDGASDGAAAHVWFRDVTDDLTTQLRFSSLKQSIPARSDVSADDLESLHSRYLSESYREFSACHQADSTCRLLLAVSGLGPAANADPCFDRLGRVLAMIAGMDVAPADESTDDQTCSHAMPATRSEAKQEFMREVLSVAQRGFRRSCRE